MSKLRLLAIALPLVTGTAALVSPSIATDPAPAARHTARPAAARQETGVAWTAPEAYRLRRDRNRHPHPTATPTASATPGPTVSPSPSPTPSASPSATPTVVPAPSASPRPTTTATPTPTPTPHPTPTATATPTPTASPAPTVPPAPTPTPTPTAPAPTAGGPSGIPGTWALKFDDEFDGTALNTAKWTPGWFGSGITPPVGSAEQQCYSGSHATVSGGFLHLTATRETNTCGGVTRQYTSGLVSSNGKFSFTYGAIEARIDVPADGAGKVANFPAWWTDGQSWPADGEIDVWEGLSGNSCWHVHNPAGGPGGCAGPTPGWHTFGASWQAGSVAFYYDGVKVGTLAHTPAAPNYLVLNNAVGSAGGATVVPSDLQVDYVRVWQ